MYKFMITIELPEDFTEEFISLIPKQRAHIDKLMDEGTILQYALSMDRQQLWVILLAKSEKSAQNVLASFPIYEYMRPTIIPLAFSNSVSHELPKIILN